MYIYTYFLSPDKTNSKPRIRISVVCGGCAVLFRGRPLRSAGGRQTPRVPIFQLPTCEYLCTLRMHFRCILSLSNFVPGAYAPRAHEIRHALSSFIILAYTLHDDLRAEAPGGSRKRKKGGRGGGGEKKSARSVKYGPESRTKFSTYLLLILHVY